MIFCFTHCEVASKPDMLILDNMGGVKQLVKQSGEYLFEVILRRHSLKSIVMTSNRPFDDWGKLIGDVPAATASSMGSGGVRCLIPPNVFPGTLSVPRSQVFDTVAHDELISSVKAKAWWIKMASCMNA